jgi:hypothetical protein
MYGPSNRIQGAITENTANVEIQNMPAIGAKV